MWVRFQPLKVVRVITVIWNTQQELITPISFNWTSPRVLLEWFPLGFSSYGGSWTRDQTYVYGFTGKCKHFTLSAVPDCFRTIFDHERITIAATPHWVTLQDGPVREFHQFCRTTVSMTEAHH